MTRPLFLLVWVSLCVTLALWLWRAEWKMEPTGLSVWSCIRPHFLLLPGQRGRQSRASGVFWSLSLTESSLQDKTHNIIWFMLILPYRTFQIQSTFGFSTNPQSKYELLKQVKFILAGSIHWAEEAHLKLGDKLCKDGEEGLCSGGLAVLSEEGGHLGELFHRLGLQGLQRLDCRVAVLQEALWVDFYTSKPAYSSWRIEGAF